MELLTTRACGVHSVAPRIQVSGIYDTWSYGDGGKVEEDVWDPACPSYPLLKQSFEVLGS